MRDTEQIRIGIAEQRKFVDSNTAAIRLGISKSRVHQLIDEGKLQAVRIGKRGWWKISKESLERMLAGFWNLKS